MEGLGICCVAVFMNAAKALLFIFSLRGTYCVAEYLAVASASVDLGATLLA